MKKLFLWILALAMVLGLASCAEKDNEVLPGVDQVDETEEEVMPTCSQSV